MPKVTVVPAKINKYTKAPENTYKRRRVAGYARVSTDHDEQFTSYEAQIDYYTNLIKGKPEWEFVGVYTDEGITGTSTKHREGFKRMIADSLAGEIDLIITKSISRFARNTVDTLTTIRSLKDAGVEVFFEKENIYTFDPKCELMLTIMGSLAQEESRSISENVIWGQRKKFADGKFSMNYGIFLGYEKGPDGTMVVNPEQAKIVKRIYALFLQGYNPTYIARILTEDGIETPGHKDKWHSGVVKSILTNEKYKGDALLQKGYLSDFLTKKYVKNEGEVPQYYVTGSHEAIIEPKIFDLVQEKISKNDTKGYGQLLFSSKIRCSKCGGYYGAKVWHSNDKYRKIVYRCNDQYKGCGSNFKFSEDDLKKAFVDKVNLLITNKGLIEEFENTAKTALDTAELRDRTEFLVTEVERLSGELDDMLSKNTKKTQNQDEYNEKYNSLLAEYDNALFELKKTNEEITGRETRQTKVKLFIRDLKQYKQPIKAFNETTFRNLVEEFKIDEKGRIKVEFKNGMVL